MNEEHMQSTNFEFLRPAWPELPSWELLPSSMCRVILLLHVLDTPSRRTLAMFVCKELGISIVDGNFLAVLKELERTKTLPKPVLDTFHQIRMSGQQGCAQSYSGQVTHSKRSKRLRLARWWVLFSTHSKGNARRRLSLSKYLLPVRGLSTSKNSHEAKRSPRC